MRIGPVSWRGLLFHISAATNAGGAAWRSVGPAGSLQGEGPICCMRLFLTRYSTGCHLFGDTLGRRDYGEEGACVWACSDMLVDLWCRFIASIHFCLQHVELGKHQPKPNLGGNIHLLIFHNLLRNNYLEQPVAGCESAQTEARRKQETKWT